MKKKKGGPLACQVCGCTDDRACFPYRCAWVTRRPPVCSTCVAFLANLRSASKLRQVLAVFGLDKIPGEGLARHPMSELHPFDW